MRGAQRRSNDMPFVFLSICTGALSVTLCIVGIVGVSMDSVAILALFLKIGYCTWISLCVTCVVAFLLLLAWTVYAAGRRFGWTKCHWLMRSFRGDSSKEATEQKSQKFASFGRILFGCNPIKCYTIPDESGKCVFLGDLAGISLKCSRFSGTILLSNRRRERVLAEPALFETEHRDICNC